MFDAFIDGLLLVLQWKAFSLMLVGMTLGFFVGLLPGIGGAATLALMLPFVFKMSPAEALAFLLGMHSVAATTGDITSVLFGVPGEAISAATVVDGYPMAKNGEAGRALGAALMSSLLGALIGAVALALAIPIVRPLVLSFGSPELFMLSLIGISCITSLSGSTPRGQIKGFAMGLLGLLGLWRRLVLLLRIITAGAAGVAGAVGAAGADTSVGAAAGHKSSSWWAVLGLSC